KQVIIEHLIGAIELTTAQGRNSVEKIIEGISSLEPELQPKAEEIGRTDFPGGSSSLLRKSIDELSQLDVEYLVPGHSTEMGSIIAGKDKVRRNFYTVKMFL
ncbi:unnamed protein product, partial [marine sediment metagenome]